MRLLNIFLFLRLFSPPCFGVVAAVGAATVAASVGGAMMQSDSAGNAADAQTAASQDANAANLKINEDQLKFLRESRDQANAAQEPFRRQGLAGQNALSRLLGTSTGLEPYKAKALVPITGTMTPAQKEAAQKTNAGITKQNALSLKAYQAQTKAVTTSPQFGSLMKDFGEKFNYGVKDFRQDPGYQFRLDQGNRDLQGRLAAMGMSNSGAALKEGMRFNQGEADQTWQRDRAFKYGQYLDRYNKYQSDRGTKQNFLSGMAGTGQAAAGQIGNNAQQFGTNAANAMGSRGSFLAQNAQNIGDANSYAALQRGNAWGGAANTLTGMASNYLGQQSAGQGNVNTAGLNKSLKTYFGG